MGERNLTLRSPKLESPDRACLEEFGPARCLCSKNLFPNFGTVDSVSKLWAYFFESSPLKRLSTSSRLSGFLALVNTTE